jgi:hypothetical protein
MLILVVAAFGSDPIPTIFLNQLYEVSYFHPSTIILMCPMVNAQPRLTPELIGRDEPPIKPSLADESRAIRAPVE